jgi:acetoin utilization protein AcuB
MFQLHGINGVQRAFIPGGIRNRRQVHAAQRTGSVTEAPATDQQTDIPRPLGSPLSRYQNKANFHIEPPIEFAYQIMTNPVFTILPSTTLHAVSAIFADKRYRHIPVVSADGALLGLISDRDFLRHRASAQHDSPRGHKEQVSSVMISEVLVATSDTRIREIARTMFEERIGSLPIVEGDGKLIGIITRSDILRAIIAHGPMNLWG